MKSFLDFHGNASIGLKPSMNLQHLIIILRKKEFHGECIISIQIDAISCNNRSIPSPTELQQRSSHSPKFFVSFFQSDTLLSLKGCMIESAIIGV